MKRWRWFILFTMGALLGAACLPQGVRAPQNPLLRALERKAGLIAFVGVDGNIYTVDQGGANLQAVTTDAEASETSQVFYNFPTWSPDGKQLAFVGVNRAAGDTRTTLFTADSDGETLVEAFSSSTNSPFYLYWSPDSQKVSFLSSMSGSNSVRLDVVPANGGDSLTLDAGQPYYWSWAPDSKSLLVHVNGASVRDSAARLAMLSVGDTVAEEGLEVRPAMFQAPEFFPDGRRLLFAAETRDGTPGLMVADRGGSVEQVLTTFEGNVAFALSPDGKRVAYISSREPRQGALGKMTVVDLSGRKEPVEIEDEPVIAFFWAPDSEQIAYFVLGFIRPDPSDDSSDSEGVQIVLNLFIADARTGQTRDIWSFPPTREFFGILPYFDQYHRSTTIWSPDSKNLLLSAYTADGIPALVVMAADGALEPRFLTAGLLGFWSSE